ncbi:sensor histidine kinase [Candidatus Nitrosotenuis aquarius]|uniref:sensor histidine kinase n=1 Tax=Candidatus Nitrosotenuis aquarius TaxID=1846278 RepID=UPI000C1DE1AE|nr:ATP-binding protein [Candidatus Nitrosotenuis aquarius]
MKITYLLILAITVLFSVYAGHSYFTYEFAIDEAKKTTLLRSQAQANNIMQDLDGHIYSKILELQSLTEIKQIQSSVIESNQKFDESDLVELESPLDITQHDRTKLMKSIFENKISARLNEFVLSDTNEYNLNVVKELFVTNQYGAVIALTTGTTDYIQADEEWWQITKNKQSFVGKMEYDKNYDDYVVPFAFPILDESSNYIGTLRITVSYHVLLEDFLNDADVLNEARKNVILVDNDGQAIYKNGQIFPSNSKIEYFSRFTTDNDSFEIGYPDIIFVSYATSIGYRDFRGFDWVVVIEQDSSVVEGFETLERNFLISTLLGIISATALGIVLSRFVTNPLARLSKITVLLGRGDFDAKIQKSKITEINTIMNSFREMEVSLKKLFETEKKLSEANARIKNERLTAIGELSASMAHDMKNPLGTIRTGMDIIKRNVGSNPEIDTVIQRMDRAVSRMSHQVEDVLNYLRKTPLLIKPASIRSIIKSAIQSLEVPKEVQISIEGQDITIDCDEKKMEILFINLILNSIQATDQDKGKITIKIKQNNNNAIIEIEDNGPGIEEKIIPDVFKPLVTTKQKGTGLGLASCKNIVEQHNGSISFQNDPTIFTITIPITQEMKNS